MKDIVASEKEATETLRQFEQKYDLLKYQVDGLAYWMALRFPLHRRLMKFSRPKRRGNQRILIGALFADFFKYWFPKKALILVRTSSSFYEFIGNQFKDMFFDDIISHYGNSFKVEVINSTNHYLGHHKNAFVPSDLTNQYITMQTLFLSKLISPRSVTGIAQQIEEKVFEGLPAVSLPRGWIGKQLVRFHWRRKLWVSLLKRIGVHIVLTSSTDDYALFAAAQDCRIPCYELQHGLFFPDHPDALWEYMSPYRGNLIAPTKLFLFGEFWQQQLSQTGFYREDELVAAGNSRIDYYLQLKDSSGIPKRSDKSIRLLLTSQGVNQGDLVEFIDRFFAICERNSLPIELIIKMHPRESDNASPYARLFDKWKQVKLISSNHPPSTYELMITVDYHLSIYSASHFDALGLGVPTIVLGLPGYTSVAPLYENGDAMLADTPEDLYRHISNPKPNRPNQEHNKYFEPNMIGNIDSYLTSWL